jgi:AraC-like DNA-binding protein
VPEHAHDWPVLSLFIIGSYWNTTEFGATFIGGPSAILYRAGAAHRNAVAADGFEQIEIEFDPRWLGSAPLPDAPVSRWLGGGMGAEARALAHTCSGELPEEQLRTSLRGFFEKTNSATEHAVPYWLGTIHRLLRENTSLNVSDLARLVARHPSWLGTAYRLATGEGLMESAARFRVERAARLLRETDISMAGIAAEAGFCDQSHMTRTFRRVLGRLPTAVRNDRQSFRQGSAVEKNPSGTVLDLTDTGCSAGPNSAAVISPNRRSGQI